MRTGPPQQQHALRVPGYVVGERIGVGGFGEVFRARHEVIDREVAIKVLHPQYSADPEAVARFVAEARAVGKLSHPGIVDLFELGKLDDGRHYLVFELVRGRTLREVLRERTRLPVDEALPVLRGIAAAVDAAHAEGIAHRDLKPDNVFVVDGGGIKLIDFGLAKLTRDHQTPVTQTGSVFGTPLYMSPEQCRGRDITLATDAYSFGVLAYHVLVGEPPFSGDALELALHHLNDPPEPPSHRLPELGERVDRVLLALLDKDPEARPLPLAKVMEAIAGGQALPPKRRSTRRWVRPALVAAAGIAMVAGGFVLRSKPAPARSCALAEDRLAGIWDARTQNALAVRFGGDRHLDVVASWKHLAPQLEAYVASWRELWEDTCISDEARRDPLLHAQRTACLDTALLQLESAMASLATVDVRQFALGYTTTYLSTVSAPLEDCRSVSVLREQRPPPPAEVRAAVTALKRRYFVARMQYQEALSTRDHPRAEQALGEYRTVADELDKLGQPSARERVDHAAQLSFLAIGGMLPSTDARVALEEAIALAQSTNDDATVVTGYLAQARALFGVSEDVATIEAALQRAEAAHVRAGHPRGVLHDAERMRAWLAMRVGRGSESIAIFQKQIEQQERPGQIASAARASLIHALVGDGRPEEAVVAARQLAALELAELGPHTRVTTALDLASLAHYHAGDLASALSAVDEALAMSTQLGDVPRLAAHEQLLWKLELALQLGRMDVVATAESALLAMAPDPASTWLAIARGTMLEFQINCCRRTVALADHALSQARALTREPAKLAEIDDLAAYRAFIRADWTAMEAAARRASSLPAEPAKWIRSPWLLAVADARTGRVKEAEGRLAALAPHRTPSRAGAHGSTNRARLFDSWVLLSLGRHRDARVLLEEARAHRPEIGRDRHHAELTAWLGIARLADGDRDGALAAFHESLSHWAIFDYFTAESWFSVARLLGESDRPRARRLAVMAERFFARVGPTRETDRAAVERWLAEHPP